MKSKVCRLDVDLETIAVALYKIPLQTYIGAAYPRSKRIAIVYREETGR